MMIIMVKLLIHKYIKSVYHCVKPNEGCINKQERKRSKGKREVSVCLGRKAIRVADFLKLDTKNAPISYLTQANIVNCLLFSSIKSKQYS